MTARHARKFLALVGVAAASACGFSHEMERALVPPGGQCPATSAGRTDALPDTTVIRWYRAAQDRDIRLSSDWCSVVGSPAVDLRPVPDFPRWEQENGLDVVTWNMEVGGGDLLAFLDAELGLECSGARPRMRAGSNPFVLLLQEAWRRDSGLPRIEGGRNVPWTIDPDAAAGRPDVVQIAEECGLSYLYIPSARNGTDRGSRPSEDMGAAVLASVPLSTPVAIELPHEAGRKVGVAATVLSPVGARVRVATAHFDVASTLIRTILSGNQTRARQADGFIDGLDAAERDGPLTGILVVGGDFNTWSSTETAIDLMRDAFPDSPPWDGEATRGSFPADHMFFRRRSFVNFSIDGYRRIENAHGSDHHARRLTVRYGADPTN
ncbi:MAG: endonuclease/exonuclease/phosphatase family protein [Gemmatimonadota bacterium]